MKHYIQKFNTPEDGDKFEINDIPWMCTVESTGQNLVCNEINKKTINEDDV